MPRAYLPNNRVKWREERAMGYDAAGVRLKQQRVTCTLQGARHRLDEPRANANYHVV